MQLQLHQVDARRHLGDRVLDLLPRVHLHQVVLAGHGVDEELHRADAPIPRASTELQRVLAQRDVLRRRQRRGRRLLHQLLVTALDRAIARADGPGRAVHVGGDLHLDVSRAGQPAFDEDGGLTEQPARLVAHALERLGQLLIGLETENRASAGARRGLQRNGEPQRARVGARALEAVGDAMPPGHDRDAEMPGELLRADLVANDAHGLGRGAEERQAEPIAELHEVRALGDEAPPGPHRVGVGLGERALEPLEIEIDDVPLPVSVLDDGSVGELDGLICFADVERVAFGRSIERDGLNRRALLAVEVPHGANQAQGGLGAVHNGDATEIGAHDGLARVSAAGDVSGRGTRRERVQTNSGKGGGRGRIADAVARTQGESNPNASRRECRPPRARRARSSAGSFLQLSRSANRGPERSGLVGRSEGRLTLHYCAMNRPVLRRVTVAVLIVALGVLVRAWNQPTWARHGMVVSQNDLASRVGADVLAEGGTAIDAAVATAFALAVTHPTAGNIGGGGFILFRPAAGEPEAYDFRETAPAAASPTMFLVDGKYNSDRHHNSHVSVGVPGTVAGLHLAWKAHGKVPWPRLVRPAIALARDGFVVTEGLARSLGSVLDDFRKYPGSRAQFTKDGAPYEAGDILKQPDLARTLERIADQGPPGFYAGETAMLIEREMKANGGLITPEDLAKYQARKRTPLRGTYRGFDLIAMPPISSGGTALLEMLNILEGFDLRAMGPGSSDYVHVVTEAMRRAFSDRARWLGDPDFVPSMPIDRLTSKEYAATLRHGISMAQASRSTPTSFEWPTESGETTHLSVVDANRNAVSLTYTLEYGYGSRIVVPGAGFLLNNEMGDFNAGPGLTDETGLIGTEPNLAQPGKRMLSSMTPTIITRDGELFMVTGSPGGRTIINTVLLTVLNVVDFGMNAQDAVDTPRFHHQWLPDVIRFERYGISTDVRANLAGRGHKLEEVRSQGVAEVILWDAKNRVLEGGVDRRASDGGARGY